jgi:hypothetical protein
MQDCHVGKCLLAMIWMREPSVEIIFGLLNRGDAILSLKYVERAADLTNEQP